QYLVREGKGHDRLRVQRGRHVDAGVIPVSAAEAYIFSGEVGLDPLEKDAQRAPAPFVDATPTLYTDMPCNLRGLSQLIELVDTPGSFLADQPAELQPIAGCVELRRLLLRIAG